MLMWILAQQPPPQQPVSSPMANVFLMALFMAVIVFIMMTTRSQQKRERREREQMYERLQKNQRVLTVGGIIGTVMSVKDAEVVLKVDETTNTKMTFLKTAVQRILDEEQTPGKT
jgi:preprotein translocase subunit YajC